MKVEFSGMDEIVDVLKDMSDTKSIEETALNKGAKHLKEQLEAGVYSHGLTRRTGKSEESFVIDPEIKDSTIEIGISNQQSDAFYLYFHEYGTSKMRARPFFRPIFESNKARIGQIMADEVRKQIGL